MSADNKPLDHAAADQTQSALPSGPAGAAIPAATGTTGLTTSDSGDQPTPKPAAPPSRTNRLGLPVLEYKGLASTLCKGCGHDAISQHIIKACYEQGVDQHLVAKLSGIGCSSKTPAYFLGQAHGFNSVHGRMPSVATGVALANRELTLLGVSGDGDTASIGLGQFGHAMRRNVPLVYIIENNGVYGLTKGQFSATADRGAPNKAGVINELPPMDLCELAITMGATFVARSFSGDAAQMVPLIKAALCHRGTAVLDVLSPCVTFNEHEGSTKSRQYAREHETPIHAIGFVPFFEQIEVDYEPGTVKEVTLHDGSRLILKKLSADYDPADRLEALKLLHKARTEKQFLTGLLYIDTARQDLIDQLALTATPLSRLPEDQLRPPQSALEEIMQSLL